MSSRISWAEYAKHTSNTDCWLLIDGKVYNVTQFLPDHPGGEKVLLKYCGLDASKAFQQQGHSQSAIQIRDSLLVGQIEHTATPEGHDQKVTQIKEEHKEIQRQKSQMKTKQLLARPVDSRNLQKAASIKRKLTLEELSKHSSEEDCWASFEGKVYDLTQFKDDHPGGKKKIMLVAGKDGTALFNQYGHTEDAKTIRQKYYIGELEGYVAEKPRTNWLLVLLTILLAGFAIYFFTVEI